MNNLIRPRENAGSEGIGLDLNGKLIEALAESGRVIVEKDKEIARLKEYNEKLRQAVATLINGDLVQSS
ncbi:hypothetical protein [Paenibacillus graminis]|uniref:Uncharacterized protein n=1 Tax=Paenibacillus graminis TaxID=189425 RepID=A0A089NKD0_9BACL|nr:hypothetical protein [Paenibacillus graminis]AIQ69499.1 hypothetical protein PGRAT_19030 [Paenibacillus graminis]